MNWRIKNDTSIQCNDSGFELFVSKRRGIFFWIVSIDNNKIIDCSSYHQESWDDMIEAMQKCESVLENYIKKK